MTTSTGVIPRCEYTGKRLRDDGVFLRHEDGTQHHGAEGHWLQIIPAPPGTWAVYESEEDGPFVDLEVQAWVLVELCDGEREIHGWAPPVNRLEGDLAWTFEADDNFRGYVRAATHAEAAAQIRTETVATSSDEQA